ncbi:MAG TPA: hypothetical protein VKE93_14625 [Candidatus Angelobacter sp.]|nr:hypothetical protein [Candidatus Angelobacter sp.]
MEIESQDDAVFTEAELSPAEQLRQQWKQQPGFIAFLRQKNVIDENAELLPYAGLLSLPGWASPRAFAFQGLVLIAILLSFLNWYETRDRGKLQEDIVTLQANVAAETKRQQETMDAARAEQKRILASPKSIVWKNVPREEALQQVDNSLQDSQKSLEEYQTKMALREKELRAQQQAETIVRSVAPLIFSLALMLAAGLVAGGIRRDYPRSNVRSAGDYYLYFATAYGLWPNLVFLLFLHFALSGAAYGLTDFSSTVGPLFWILFWIGFYFLLVRYLGSVARDMFKALQIRPPANEWSPANRMLLRLHNSFLLAFVVMEAAFLSLMYFFYLAGKSF